jgi:cytochrome c oxidase subunit 2
MIVPRAAAFVMFIASVTVLAGCSGEQSVLDPKGESAESISKLAMVLFAGGSFVLLFVVAATAAALAGPSLIRTALGGETAILVGGVAFPAVVLTALLIYGVLAASPLQATSEPLRVAIEGKQWWWRVRYEVDGRAFETANEIRVPVGRPVSFDLTSGDVIHSFWVPNLAGKLDMLPGRRTQLTAVATQAGVMRGQCAEFCGGPHGLMSLRVVAMAAEQFDAWAAQPRQQQTSGAGYRLFVAAGCGGCHAVDGTAANGRIGPNLSDFGTRAMLGAETLPVTHENVSRWITSAKSIKPESLMPDFAHLTPDEVSTLSTYLMGLK